MSLPKKSKILLTGAAGFIGSCMASFLNKLGYNDLILADDFNNPVKANNYSKLTTALLINRSHLDDFLLNHPKIDFVIHFGARTDTAEMDYSVLEILNLNASKKLWNYCAINQVPFIYASSAATYGNGEHGFEDTHEIISRLNPMNPYGITKNEFDKFVIANTKENKLCPPNWYGLKFFNVYGPNEFHKGRMASVVFHFFNQINATKSLRLFRSHHPDFKDGEQKRDFIYVKDVIAITYWLMNCLPENGMYNVGTGKANTFLELGHSIFNTMNLKPVFHFIDTPSDIRASYQYFTEANISKLQGVGYTETFTPLSEGIKDYLNGYLIDMKYY